MQRGGKMDNMPEVILTELVCKRCGYTWVARLKVVKQCSRCKSFYWNQDRGIKPPEVKPDNEIKTTL